MKLMFFFLCYKSKAALSVQHVYERSLTGCLVRLKPNITKKEPSVTKIYLEDKPFKVFKVCGPVKGLTICYLQLCLLFSQYL